MDESKGETWRFTTTAEHADQVYLVVDGTFTPSRWILMQPTDGKPGDWSVTADIAPGPHRLRYFTVENGAYLNCGSTGLRGKRTSAMDPTVQLENRDLAASA